MPVLPDALRHPVLLTQEQLLRGLAHIHWARRIARDPQRGTSSRRQKTGEAGERAAYFYLRRKGLVIVAHRWRSPHDDGEVDLIAWDGGTLCFIEVKTRTAEDRFGAEYAISPGKQEALRRMARAYVHGLPWSGNERARPPLRFDLVAVYLTGKQPRLEHRPGYF